MWDVLHVIGVTYRVSIGGKTEPSVKDVHDINNKINT